MDYDSKFEKRKTILPDYIFGFTLEMFSPKFLFGARNKFHYLNLTGMHISSRLFNTDFEKNFYETLIKKNTVVSTDHLTPELKLRLITPECDLWHCKETESQFPNDPFWGIYWPGGQALARYILDNKVMFNQKTVLDIGSGSGACALAAARSGAKFVLANDIDPVSICAVQINSRLNNLKVHTYEQDLIGENIDSLVIKSDNVTQQLEWNVILAVEKNKLVLVGDPGRHALKELESMKNTGHFEEVAEYPLVNKGHNGFSRSSVFKIVLSNDFSKTDDSMSSLT